MELHNFGQSRIDPRERTERLVDREEIGDGTGLDELIQCHIVALGVSTAFSGETSTRVVHKYISHRGGRAREELPTSGHPDLRLVYELQVRFMHERGGVQGLLRRTSALRVSELAQLGVHHGYQQRKCLRFATIEALQCLGYFLARSHVFPEKASERRGLLYLSNLCSAA